MRSDLEYAIFLAVNHPAEILTAPQVAELLGVSDETVRRWVAQGRIAHFLLPSGKPRFRRADIDAILAGTASGEAAG